MVKAIICDRCGKAVRNIGNISRIEIYDYIEFNSVNASEVITKDICNECLNKIMLFIDSKEELENTEQHTLCKKVDGDNYPRCINLINKKYCKAKSCNALDC